MNRSLIEISKEKLLIAIKSIYKFEDCLNFSSTYPASHELILAVLIFVENNSTHIFGTYSKLFQCKIDRIDF